MIIKIWGIKNSKKGAMVGLNRSLNYVKNEDKTSTETDMIKEMDNLENNIDDLDELDENKEISLDDIQRISEENINRTLNYMSNEEKIKNKYISGYLCDVEFATEQFMMTKEKNLAAVGKTLDDDKGNVAFHIIQSFPADIDISDEEVHQCGLELCEKIGLYQAVVCSHVNPQPDEKGNMKGKCKHNHIIINSHTLDPVRQNGDIKKMKYHDCKETYYKLRVYNDEIAMNHNLPIIDEPDNSKNYSWYENESIEQNNSWKQGIRNDIDSLKRGCRSFEKLKDVLIKNGYEIEERDNCVLYKKGNNRAIKDKTLGREYTREYLERYWKGLENIEKDVKSELEKNILKAKSDNEFKLRTLYINKRFLNKNTKKPFYISMYDENGIKRNLLELVIMLAMVVMQAYKDDFVYNDKAVETYLNRYNNKLQNMMEALRYAREEKVENIEDLENRIKNVGINISKIKNKINSKEKTLNKMTFIKDILGKYLKVKDNCERIKNIENKEERQIEIDKYSNDLNIYKENKALLYKYKLTTDEEINNFINKFKDIDNNIKDLKEKQKKYSEQYRKYKKIQYYYNLAQDYNYVYGIDETDKYKYNQSENVEKNKDNEVEKDKSKEKGR